MEVETIAMHDLHPAQWNPRKISDKEKEDLKRSLQEFGCVEPLVIRSEDMSIVGGHQRYWSALDLGWSEIPCVKVSLTDTKAKLLNIALNKIHGEWDVDKLAGVIEQLKLEDADISLSGFDEISLAEVGVVGEGGYGVFGLPSGDKPPVETMIFNATAKQKVYILGMLDELSGSGDHQEAMTKMQEKYGGDDDKVAPRTLALLYLCDANEATIF